MTKTKTAKPATTPIQIHPTQMIKLSLLDVDEANVRQIKNGITIEQLAEDIAARGLLQSLNVHALNDNDDNPSGRFGVIAGGRRLKALKLLVKSKQLEPDTAIPCIVQPGTNAVDDSLAENTFREALHPLDQFRAFKAMRDAKTPDTDIAKRYHVTVKFVEQRLKLCAASPKLLKAYEAGTLTLEQLEAFCVSDDHKRQNEVLKAIENGQHGNAFTIRRMLTESSIDASDERVVYIGLQAYTDAGGTIMQDLFKDDSGPWIENPDLLNKLVEDKKQVDRAAILAKGFKWAEICLEDREIWDLKRNLQRIPNMPSPFSKEERAEFDKLSAECDQLCEKRDYADEDDVFTNDDEARLIELEKIITEMDNRPPKFSKGAMARSGVIASINECGLLKLEYGFLRAEDCKPAKIKAHVTLGADDDQYDTDEDDDSDEIHHEPADANTGTIIANKPMSNSLATELTSYRTIGLQDALAQNFPIAFLAALHPLACNTFYGRKLRDANSSGAYYTTDQGYRSCVKIAPTEKQFHGVKGIEDFPASKAIAARHAEWLERLPEDAADLWAALNALTLEERTQLFAHCVSRTIDAVHGNQGRGAAALHADQLALAVSLDMKAAGWVTTSENYFSRISIPQIIQEVTDAKDAVMASRIDHFKKPLMAKEAERLVSDTEWLPALLRSPAQFEAGDQPGDRDATEDDAPSTPLPPFLAGGLNGASSAPAA